MSTNRSRGIEIAHARPPTGSTRSKLMLSALWVPRASSWRPMWIGSSGSMPSALSSPTIRKLTGSDGSVSVNRRSPENSMRPISATPS